MISVAYFAYHYLHYLLRIPLYYSSQDRIQFQEQYFPYLYFVRQSFDPVHFLTVVADFHFDHCCPHFHHFEYFVGLYLDLLNPNLE